MTKSMLEYSKTVLKKVSFDAKLFCKELKKAVDLLLPEEVEELKHWLQHFITDKPELQFKDDGTYLMTTSENVIEQSGVFRFENEEIFMDFNFEGSSKTVGYTAELTTTQLTLSPSFPTICIEGCFYRFEKK